MTHTSDSVENSLIDTDFVLRIYNTLAQVFVMASRRTGKGITSQEVTRSQHEFQDLKRRAKMSSSISLPFSAQLIFSIFHAFFSSSRINKILGHKKG